MVRYWDYEYKVRGTQYSPFLVTNIDNRVVSSGPERRTRERKAVPYVPPPQDFLPLANRWLYVGLHPNETTIGFYN